MGYWQTDPRFHVTADPLVSGTVDEARLRGSTNPHVWAEEFAKVAPHVDLRVSAQWFAQCMAVAVDHEARLEPPEHDESRYR